MADAPSRPRGALRVTFLLLAYLFVLSLVVQVYLAGYGLFGGGFEAHVAFGWGAVHAVGFLMLLASLVARVGRGLVLWTTATFVVAFFMPMLVSAGNSLLAALHPVAALLVFAMALYVTVAARAFVPRPLGSARGIPARGTKEPASA